MTAPAVVCSRNVSAGIRPAPGAAARLPAWWGADDWLQEVRGALTEELLREHRIAADTVVKVAEAHAAFADYRTGRDCRPTNERLLGAALCSLSTIKRARRVLKSLGLLVELVGGRSCMTYAERIAAWRRGSSHRQIAAEFALCSRRRRAPKMSAPKVREGTHFPGAGRTTVDGDPPPGARKVSSLSHLRSTHLRRRTETRKPLRGAHTEELGAEPAGGGHDGRTRRLAEDVQRRVRWLSGVSTRRTMPTLARFARAGWGPRDVELAVRDVLARRSWRLPGSLQHPAAYLAKLLRELDPADRPTAAEEWAAATKRETERTWFAAMRTTCPHGVPAGHVPHPVRGVPDCPRCRRS